MEPYWIKGRRHPFHEGKGCADSWIRKNQLDRIRRLPISLAVTTAGLGLYIVLSRALFGRCCPFQVFCGLPCPGCGLLHAGVEVLSLNWIQAWRINPCIYLWIALAVLFGVHEVTGKISTGFLWGFLILTCLTTIGVYGFRMLTVYPSYPMDYYPDNILFRISQL